MQSISYSWQGIKSRWNTTYMFDIARMFYFVVDHLIKQFNRFPPDLIVMHERHVHIARQVVLFSLDFSTRFKPGRQPFNTVEWKGHFLSGVKLKNGGSTLEKRQTDFPNEYGLTQFARSKVSLLFLQWSWFCVHLTKRCVPPFCAKCKCNSI